MPEERKRTQGSEDVERVIDHLSDEYKKTQKEEWIRHNYSKNKMPKNKEEGNANSDKS